MNKEYLKMLLAQLGVQSVFVAADQAVRTVVASKIKPLLGNSETQNKK